MTAMANAVFVIKKTVRPELVEGLWWFDKLTTNSIILLYFSYIKFAVCLSIRVFRGLLLFHA
jgi:hypothetical protein